jgi:thiol-disulfide isomerase/thioredoxin
LIGALVHFARKWGSRENVKKRVLIILVCAGALVLFLLGLRQTQGVRSSLAAGTGSSPEKGLTTIRFVKNPEPLPNFALMGLDGQVLSPAEWQGKAVLLNFWATWCPPCREEIPDLIELQAKYSDRLQIVGFSVDEGSPDAVKGFVQKARLNYPVAIVSPEFQAKFGGILGLPTSFVVDTNGRVVQKHVGLRDPALYEVEIRALLGLPVQAKIETFEDTGQIFLTNAKRATELPGVDLSKLTPERKQAALRQFNEQKCTCGCGLTLAQCRINDSSCPVSQATATQIVEKIARAQASPTK